MAAGTATTIRTTTSAASASASRRPPTRRPTRCRPLFARFWPSPRPAHAGPDRRPCSAIGARRCRVERGEREDRGAVEAASRRARRSWRCSPRRDTAQTFVLARGDFLKPSSRCSRACPAFLHPLKAGKSRHGSTLPAGWSMAVADGGARDRQPRLAGVLRQRPCQHQRRLRHARRSAVASRAARLAGGRVHGARLEPQAAAPADRHLGDLPAVVARDAGAAGPRSRQPPAGPRRRAFGSRPRSVRDVALAASGLLNPKVGGRRVYPPAPEFLFVPPASYGPKVWTEETAPTATAGPCTPSASARCRIPCCRLRRPQRRVRVRPARAVEYAAAGPATLNEPLFLERRSGE